MLWIVTMKFKNGNFAIIKDRAKDIETVREHIGQKVENRDLIKSFTIVEA